MKIIDNVIYDVTQEDIVELYNLGEDEVYSFFSGKKFPVNDSPVKKIALCTDQPHFKRGHYKAILDMADELKAAGYEIVLFLVDMPEDEDNPSNHPVEVLPAGLNDDPESCRERVKSIEEACIRQGVDTVIINHYVAWKKMTDLMAFKRVEIDGRPIRCILQFHSLFCKKQYTEIASNWLENNSLCISAFDVLLVESETDRTYWEAWHPNVFYRPLFTSKGMPDKPELSGDPKTVVYMGALDRTKNQKEAIYAFQEVLKKVPDAKLALAGDGADDYVSELIELVNDLGIQRSVDFVGYIDEAGKKALVSKSACCISTSRYEGYPLVLMEFMSRGLPIVMYDIPGVMVADGGENSGVVVVRQRDRKGLAEAIIRIISDEQYRTNLGEKARKRIETLNDFDYISFWKEVFEKAGTERATVDADAQQKVYKTLFNALANNRILLEDERRRNRYKMAAGRTQSLPTLTGRRVVATEAGSYADITVYFREPFLRKPQVVCSVYSTSETGDIGKITASAIKINEECFTIRVFNADTVRRKPAVSWVAILQQL